MEAYYAGESMIFPADTLDLPALRNLLRSRRMGPGKKDLFYGQLRASLPDFLDQSVIYLGNYPHFYGEEAAMNTEILYEVPLKKGRVCARMNVAQDLQTVSEKADLDSPYDDKRRAPVFDGLSGKSGIVIRGQYCQGTDPDKGLYLGVETGSMRESQQDSLDNIPYLVTKKVLNALCESKPLHWQEEVPPYSPLSVHSREIRANLKDLRLPELREAEPHIDEFFNWVASCRKKIQTALVMGNFYYEQVRLERQLQELQDFKIISLKRMPASAAATLEIFAGLMDDLHPPQNRRMEYLVHS